MNEAIINWMILNRLPTGWYPQQGSYANGEWDPELVAAVDGLIPAEVEDVYVDVIGEFGIPQFGFCIRCEKDITPTSKKMIRHYYSTSDTSDSGWVTFNWSI